MKKVFIVLTCFILIGGGYYIYKYNKISPDRSISPDGVLKELMKESGAVSKCVYKNKVVYYVLSPCCDQYNYLYSENGKRICAPDGGLAGGGDGKCPDFSDSQNNCQLIRKSLDNK